ncbi:hypothetical protein ACEQ8H_004951 [Pleosporales sp. CAS-2024a]
MRRTPASWTSPSRSITNTPSQSAAQPQPSDNDGSFSEQPDQQEPPQQTSDITFRRIAPGEQRAMSQAIDAIIPNLRQPRPGATTFAPIGQPTSSDELRAAAAQNRVFGAPFSDPMSPHRRAGRAPPALNFDDMSMPDGMVDPNLSNKPLESASLAIQQEETFANYPRLTPTYGRRVELDPLRGRDLIRGIGMLGGLMQRNRVKSDTIKQRFHERPGLRRKRLNSERWRKRFKIGFKTITKRVTELTAKGW